MQRRGNLLTSSLASGFIFGFLSGIPFVGALNCACCSLILGAGILTSYLLVKGSDVSLSWGRAAAGGLLSGLIAVPVHVLTAWTFAVIRGTDITAEFDQAIDQIAQMSPEMQEGAQALRGIGLAVILAFALCMLVVAYSVFGTIGGLLGRSIFERRTPQPIPVSPPPSQGPGGNVPPVNPS